MAKNNSDIKIIFMGTPIFAVTILEALQEDGFAHATYEVLKQHQFYKGELRGWRADSGRAAELVANLRGLGESFSDWKPYGGSRDESYLQSVHEHLARIGWRIETL